MLALGVMVTDFCLNTTPPQPPVIVYIMSHVPTDTPVTSPVDELTVAIAISLLVHAPVPPPRIAELALYVSVPPIHKGVAPVTDARLASGVIVTVCCLNTTPPQPPVIVYIMLLVPADTPVTTPVEELTVATEVLLLLHAPVPPLRTTEVALYVAVAAIHKGVVPVTDAMLAFGDIVTACCLVTVTPPQPPVIV